MEATAKTKQQKNKNKHPTFKEEKNFFFLNSFYYFINM